MKIDSATCRRCAECCRHHAFVQVSRDEVEEMELFTGLSREAFTNPVSETGEGFFLQYTDDGDCVFLHATDGGYACAVYAARSRTCRDYPSRPDQDKACTANSSLRQPGDSG